LGAAVGLCGGQVGRIEEERPQGRFLLGLGNSSPLDP
jgi:hypothetical protein